ncbi:hypothetical protein CBFG_05516 [Clostridiales bacterium 1_7_47FAA]|uniref:Uncharacterized protein n=1 Tax=Enterocloster hominis (ex Hitch et al. 2024) TaxID=1917870 RepID=A0ABV1DEB7_9FIRM|nr:hypothetical protein CBFG_05516 [Clostridiales bacterium 1_7_47FAA]
MGDFNKQKYDNQYAKENYDRCIFNVPKGQKTVIEAHWKAKGYKSLNAYVNDLIARDMERTGEKSIHTQNSNGVIVGDNKGKVIVGDIKGNITM